MSQCDYLTDRDLSIIIALVGQHRAQHFAKLDDPTIYHKLSRPPLNQVERVLAVFHLLPSQIEGNFYLESMNTQALNHLRGANS